MFLNQIGNKDFERVIFRAASDEKIGPKCLFESDDFRLESFFEGRPLTVWEMRNPTLMMACCDKLFAYNFNTKIRAACEQVQKADKNHLYIDTIINEWASEVQTKLLEWRAQFNQDKAKHGFALEVIDKFEQNVLFEGYQTYLS